MALSLPLGAGRLTRERLRGDPPTAAEVDALREYVDAPAGQGGRSQDWDRAAATSKTFRSLARLAGAAPVRGGLPGPPLVDANGLHQVLGFIQRMPSAALGEMDGVSAARAHQLLAGAVVAEAAMRRLGVDAGRHLPVGAARGCDPAAARRPRESRDRTGTVRRLR